MAIPLFVVWMKGVFTDKMPMGKSETVSTSKCYYYHSLFFFFEIVYHCVTHAGLDLSTKAKLTPNLRPSYLSF